MTLDPLVTCSACGHATATVDRFCEACGRALSASATQPPGPVDRTEFDHGRIAAVSDRGLLHERNEDAYVIDVVGDRVIAVVCDGVSTSTAPELAARIGADTAARVLSTSTSTGIEPEVEMEHAIVAARRSGRRDRLVTGARRRRTVLDDRRRLVHRGHGDDREPG